MSADFGHRVRLSEIRDGQRIDITATPDERAAVAQRFGLAGLDRLEAHAVLSREGETVQAQGRVAASLEQSCVVTGEPVAAHVDEPFEIAFVPAPSGGGADEEVELGPEDCDVVFHDGAAIDLGAAVADTLALALDPYPRSAGAEAALKDAGVISEEEAGPFAALAQLKKSLGGDEG